MDCYYNKTLAQWDVDHICIYIFKWIQYVTQVYITRIFKCRTLNAMNTLESIWLALLATAFLIVLVYNVYTHSFWGMSWT